MLAAKNGDQNRCPRSVPMGGDMRSFMGWVGLGWVRLLFSRQTLRVVLRAAFVLIMAFSTAFGFLTGTRGSGREVLQPLSVELPLLVSGSATVSDEVTPFGEVSRRPSPAEAPASVPGRPRPRFQTRPMS